MVRILTKDYTELDLTKGFEFQIEMENPMLDDLSFSFLYTYNSCFSTLALAGRPLFLVIGLAFET